MSPPVNIKFPPEFLAVTIIFKVSPMNIDELSKPATTEFVALAAARDRWVELFIWFRISDWIILSRIFLCIYEKLN